MDRLQIREWTCKVCYGVVLVSSLAEFIFCQDVPNSPPKAGAQPVEKTQPHGFSIPKMPAQLDKFDGGRYLESIDVPDPGLLLDPDAKIQLRAAIIRTAEICGLSSNTQPVLSKQSPVWKLLTHNFPEARDLAEKKNGVSKDEVDVKALARVLLDKEVEKYILGYIIPPFPSDTRNFDAGKYFESMEVPNVHMALSLDSKRLIRGLVTNFANLSKARTKKESVLSKQCAFWQLLQNNFPELNDPDFQKKIASESQINLGELSDLLFHGGLR